MSKNKREQILAIRYVKTNSLYIRIIYNIAIIEPSYAESYQPSMILH